MMEFPGSLIIILIFVALIVGVLLVISSIIFLVGWKFRIRVLKWFACVPIMGGISLISAVTIFLSVVITAMIISLISPTIVFRTHFNMSPPEGMYHLKGFEIDFGNGPDIYLAFQTDSTALNKILGNHSREISNYDFSTTLNNSIYFSGHPHFWNPYHNSNPTKFYAYLPNSNDTTIPEGTLSYDTSSHWVYYHWNKWEF